jgi:enamine deaminase RidA (YjgF/YER057c/UK114 family)
MAARKQVPGLQRCWRFLLLRTPVSINASSREAQAMAASNRRQSIVPAPFQGHYDAYHFSPATRVGDMVWVSGQVGVDADMKPAQGMHAQARIAFECLKLVLEEAGASLADVVELTTFHTDLQPLSVVVSRGGDAVGLARIADRDSRNGRGRIRRGMSA